MLKLKKVFVDGMELIMMNDKFFTTLTDDRGAREKFWIKRLSKRDLDYMKKVDSKMTLFKYNRNDVSCENWGEVLASAFARVIDIPCVDYSSAQLIDYDGSEVGMGVVCNSYKKHVDEVEYSGFALQSQYNTYAFDNYRGKSIDGINTVDGFMASLHGMFKGKIKSEDEKQIRDDLLKQAIFDFLTAQTDRHWLNTTFLVSLDEKQKGENIKFNIRKAACYDNGCIAFLKRKASAIEGMSREVGKLGKDSPYLKAQLEKYCPMMGITTSLVELDNNIPNDNIDRVRMRDNKEKRQVFLTELSNEIIKNAELSRFFVEIKMKIKDGTLMNEVFEDLERRGENPPLYVKKMVKDVIEHQFDVINENIHIAVEEANASQRERGM